MIKDTQLNEEQKQIARIWDWTKTIHFDSAGNKELRECDECYAEFYELAPFEISENGRVDTFDFCRNCAIKIYQKIV